MTHRDVDPKVLLLDAVRLGVEPEFDRIFDRRLFCAFPDRDRVGSEATSFWPSSDGTVLYKKPSERSGEICRFFVSAGSIPHYTRDVREAIALARRVLGAEICFGLSSTGIMSTCTIWRAGPKQDIYAGYQLLQRGPDAEAAVCVAAMLKCAVSL
jgi:hypothetical protein